MISYHYLMFSIPFTGMIYKQSKTTNMFGLLSKSQDFNRNKNILDPTSFLSGKLFKRNIFVLKYK